MNWFDYSQYLLDKCKQQGTPFHCGFELTPFCNFRCNMCYIRLTEAQASKQGHLLSTEQWIRLAEEAKKMGTISMEVTGGEALTRRDFPTLYKSFIDLGFLIVLRTNGYLIDSKILNLLKEYKPRKIMITLYGASNETYNRVCGVSDGYTVVTRNILALREAGLNVQLTSTITNENKNDIDLMQQWARDNGFSLSMGGMLFTPIRGAKRSVDSLKIRLPEELYQVPKEYQSISRVIPNREYYQENPFWMCRAFRAKFTITWDGKVTMCNSNPSVSKDPFVSGLSSAYYALYGDIKKIQRPKECATCKYIDLCTVCPSMFYSATGSMEQTNDEMCHMARRRFVQMMRSDDSLHARDLISTDECKEGV